MSILIMSQVWENGPDDKAELVVMLALADFANDDGECWPSMDTIGKKARMSERNARRVLRKLEADGYVETVEGRGRHGGNKYVIKSDKMSPRTKCPPGQNEQENRTKRAGKPDIAVSAKPSRTIIEPSIGISPCVPQGKKPRRRPEVPLPPDWVPSEKNLSDAAERQFSAMETEHEADRFRNHHTAKGSLFRDWDAAWRTWLGNARKFSGGRMAFQASPGRHGQGSSIASIVARRRIEGTV